MFDLAIIETGSGGDLQLLGNDLAVVNGIENMAYLGMFGGNLEQSTVDNEVNEFSLDWWGNTLLMKSNPSIQMNSIVERTLNSTPLTSAGRLVIENAIKYDLVFLEKIIGSQIEVSVSIISDDRIDVTLRINFLKETRVTVIKFKKQSDGDFSIFDFNQDFYNINL
jgi:hypothetical protein